MNKHLQDPNDDGISWNDVEDRIWEDLCKQRESGKSDEVDSAYWENYTENENYKSYFPKQESFIEIGSRRIICQNTLVH